MLQRMLALAQKEFIQIRRDKRTLAMMIVIPVIWLLLFGYAFTFDIDEVAVAVVDLSGTAAGERVARAVREYERFRAVDLAAATEEAIYDAFHRDQIKMAVLLPRGFGDGANDVQMQVLIDGSDLFASQTGARLISRALEPVQTEIRAETTERFKEELARQLKAHAEARAAAVLEQVPPAMKPQVAQMLAGAAQQPVAPLDLSAVAPPAMAPDLKILYNPDLKSAPVMIPGLLGMVVMFMTTLMTAMGVVREREHGTMEQLVVTPIRPVELMLGKIIPYFFIGCLDFALVYFAGIYLFDLEFAGNLPVFMALSLLLVFTTLGLGLLLSTVAQNQQQAMQLALMTILPQVLVSGMIFPLSSLPKVIQYIAYVLPFTHYVPIARGMFIKGQEFELLWVPATVLAVYAVAVVALATVRFRKRLA
ncbi:MAG: ABC transporter permease [Bacillota bacterium]